MNYIFRTRPYGYTHQTAHTRVRCTVFLHLFKQLFSSDITSSIGSLPVKDVQSGYSTVPVEMFFYSQ